MSNLICEGCGVPARLAPKMDHGRGVLYGQRGPFWLCQDCMNLDAETLDHQRQRVAMIRQMNFDFGRLRFLPEELALAYDWILEFVDAGTWPEDNWQTLSGKLDLNFWWNEELGACAADLYRVKDGRTDTSRWRRIFTRLRPEIPMFA